MAQDEKTEKSSKVTFVKCYFDLFDSAFKVLSRLIITLGLLLTTLYCIHINFYPKSLSAGDAILFTFSIISFGAINVFGVVYGVVSTFCILIFITRVSNKFAKYGFSESLSENTSGRIEAFKYREIRPIKGLEGWFSIILSALTLAIFCLTALVMYLSHADSERVFNFIRLLASFAAGGFLINCAILFEGAKMPDGGGLIENENPYIRFIAIPVVAFLLPIIIGNAGFMLETSMRMIDLRVENMPVRLSEENYQTVSSIARLFKIDMRDCQTDLANEHIVYGVDILWHGIGSTARTRIGASSKADRDAGKPFVEFNLKDEGISSLIATKPECVVKG